MQVGKVPPALPALRLELGLGLVTAGWVVSIFGATSAFFGIAAGIAADRLGRPQMLVLGLFCLALGSGLGGFSQSGALLLGARAIEGIGFVAIGVSAPSLIALAASAADQRIALALWGSYMPTGMAAMMLLAPPLLSRFGWRGLWLAEAGLLLLVMLAAIAILRPVRGQQPRTTAWAWRDVRSALVLPGPWLLAAGFGLYTVQWMAVMSWLPTFLVDAAAISLGNAAILTAVAVLINAPGNWFGGFLLHRGLPRWLVLVLAEISLGLFGYEMFAAALPDATKYALLLAFSFFGGMLPSATLAGVPVHARTPEQIGATNGVLVQGANLGVLLGAPAFAAIAAAFGGWQSAAWLLPLVASIGIAVALTLGLVERRA